jgi:hypothetical protein
MTDEKILDIEAPDASPHKIYSKNWIVAGALLGGPMAGAFFLSQNFKAFGEENKSRKTLIIGGLVMLGLLLIVTFVPEAGQFGRLAAIMPVIMTNHFANFYQKNKIDEHEKAGGKMQEWWRVLGITLLILLITFILVLACNCIADFNSPANLGR